MAFVSVPNDLSKVKTKMAFNLTKRQLICFGAAAAVGIPSYLLTRSAIGSTGAMFLMLAVMLPAFMLAMYERDGLPAEKVLRNFVRARFLWPGTRPYKTENFYAGLNCHNKEVHRLDTGKENKAAPAQQGAQAGGAADRPADHSL